MSNTVQTISSSSPSICIPRVFHNITKDFIERTFNDLFDGRYVERVDLIHKTSERGENFQRAFIHFYRWPTRNRDAVEIREKLLSGREVNITYDHPWFWRCSASRSAPRTENPRPQQRRAPYIVSEEANREQYRRREERPRSPRREERTRSPRREERPRPSREPIELKMSEKELIGHEVYYRLITSFNCVTSLAAKLTGMLLEMETAELVDMLRSPEKMCARVSEAQLALAKYVTQKPPTAEEKSEIYGPQIYNQLTQNFGVSTTYAGKITGMLLELNFRELDILLNSKEKLAARIDEAMKILAEASWSK